MSQRSMLQEEYESLSRLLRNLNRIVITARRSKPSSTTQGVSIPDQAPELIKDLQFVSLNFQLDNSRTANRDDVVAEVLRSLPADTHDRLSAQVADITTRLSKGSTTLSRDDIATLDVLAATLDRASAALFERIQTP